MAGAFKDSGDERSTTRSTISAGQTVLSAADEASRAVLEGLDRGATNDATTGKLAQGWDGQKLQQQSRLNAQIVADLGAQASKDLGTCAGDQAEALKISCGTAALRLRSASRTGARPRSRVRGSHHSALAASH
ncbi:hypothetical protein CLD22_30110, partial [Rubrivivax gelatinosus]|nr:hypothetical protein [Rubrivivax gelatinosus]